MILIYNLLNASLNFKCQVSKRIMLQFLCYFNCKAKVNLLTGLHIQDYNN